MKKWERRKLRACNLEAKVVTTILFVNLEYKLHALTEKEEITARFQ